MYEIPNHFTRRFAHRRLWLHDLKLDSSLPESSPRSKDPKAYRLAFSSALSDAHKEKDRILADKALISRVLSRSPYTLPEEWEDLRWFANPSEGAEWIDGRSGDVMILKGPVVPPAAVGRGVGEGSSSSAAPSAASPTASAPSNSLPVSLLPSDLLHFRAGEGHEGEATLSEIMEGLDAGEIDEYCMVYVDGDWIGVMKVVEEVGEKQNEQQEKPEPDRQEEEEKKRDDVEEPPPLPLPPSPEPDTATVPVALKPKSPPPLPKKLMKKIGEALMQWSMICPNDRLLLGLSGGKDSLTLLHALLAVQKRAPIKFEIGACTIDPMTDSFDPSPLIPYVESLGIPYYYVRQPIVEKAETSGPNGGPVTSLCR